MGSPILNLVAWPLPISTMLLGALIGPLAFNAMLLVRAAAGARPGEGLAVWRSLSVLVGMPVGAFHGLVYGGWWWLVFRLHWPLGWLLALGLAPIAVIMVRTVLCRRYYDDNDWWWQVTGEVSLGAVWLAGTVLACLHVVVTLAAA